MNLFDFFEKMKFDLFECFPYYRKGLTDNFFITFTNCALKLLTC